MVRCNAGGRCVATNVTGRSVATRAVAPRTQFRTLPAERMRRESTHRRAEVAVHEAAATAVARRRLSAATAEATVAAYPCGGGRAAALCNTAAEITYVYYARSTLGRFRDRTKRELPDGTGRVLFPEQRGLTATVYAWDRVPCSPVESPRTTPPASAHQGDGLPLEWSGGSVWTPVRVGRYGCFRRGPVRAPGLWENSRGQDLRDHCEQDGREVAHDSPARERHRAGKTCP
jgi:hypothetical protein